MMMVVFKCCGWRGWAGLSSSQMVLGAIGIQVGAEGNLSKDGSAHSHGSAEPCLCCCAGAGEMPSCSGSGAAGRAQWISVKPKRVPKIRQRGLVPPPLCLMDHPQVQGRGSITSMLPREQLQDHGASDWESGAAAVEGSWKQISSCSRFEVVGENEPVKSRAGLQPLTSTTPLENLGRKHAQSPWKLVN